MGDVDAALKERLDRLAAARSGAGRGQIAPTARTNAVAKRRRHPAKHSRTAALALSVLASGGLGVWFSSTSPGSTAPVSAAGIVTESAPGAAAARSSSAVAAPVTTPALAKAATASQGVESLVSAATTAPEPSTTAVEITIPPVPVTINGASFRNKWGDVQVQATFAPDGTLTNVAMLQVPFRDGKSVRINDRAVPRLNSEALSAQSAQIDTVSGATYTSVGYKQSLQSAIDVAVANGIAAGATA